MNPDQSINIVRQRKDDPFARIPKELLADPDLSWKAKGILAYILGKKDTWKVWVKDLVNQGTDGETSVRSALQEIRNVGYAKLERLVKNGRIVTWRLTVSDEPIFKDVPEKGWPPVEIPDVEIQHHSKNDGSETDGSKNELNKEERSVGLHENKLSPLGDRIASWFGRRPTTQWTPKEIKTLKAVEDLKTPLEDIAILEGYYLSNAPYKRRDIMTLMNNWNTEIDRVRNGGMKDIQIRGRFGSSTPPPTVAPMRNESAHLDPNASLGQLPGI